MALAEMVGYILQRIFNQVMGPVALLGVKGDTVHFERDRHGTSILLSRWI